MSFYSCYNLKNNLKRVNLKGLLVMYIKLDYPENFWYDFKNTEPTNHKRCKSKPQWAITSHLSEWLSSKSLQITNAGEDVRKGNPWTLLVGMKIGAATMENSMEVPQKTKNRTAIWSSNSTPGYISEENGNTNLKRYMHPNVHSSIIYNSQDMEAT